MGISGSNTWGGTYHIFFGLYNIGLNFREYHHKIWPTKYGAFTYLHVLDPEDLPLTKEEFEGFQEANGDRMVM